VPNVESSWVASLLNDFKENRRDLNFKWEAPDLILWRIRFERRHGTVARRTKQLMRLDCNQNRQKLKSVNEQRV